MFLKKKKYTQKRYNENKNKNKNARKELLRKYDLKKEYQDTKKKHNMIKGRRKN